MALVVGLHAQTESSTDTIAASIGCQEESSSSFSLQLGISAGSTLYFNNNDHSPYFSKYGFNVQIPLLASWQLTPHWKLSTGLRYDFVWEPLYYAVEPAGTNHDDLFDRGLQFLDSERRVHSLNAPVLQVAHADPWGVDADRVEEKEEDDAVQASD